MANPFSAYLESRVLAASPLQLIHLAYEGAVESVAEARRHLAEGKIFERANAITRAQQIIAELRASLDFERGGDLSPRLASLYDYMQRRLQEGHFKQADEPLAEVHELLTTVDEAWKQLATSDTTPAEGHTSAPSPWMSAEQTEYGRPAYSL